MQPLARCQYKTSATGSAHPQVRFARHAGACGAVRVGVQAAEEKEKTRAANDEEASTEASSPKAPCKTVHAWVLAMPGMRNISEPVFIETTTVGALSRACPASVHQRVDMRKRMPSCAHAYPCVCVCARVCVFLCVCLCAHEQGILLVLALAGGKNAALAEAAQRCWSQQVERCCRHR